MAKHTPGPWGWFGNSGSKTLYLATTHSGRRFVLDFVRWGMSGAQPRFQSEKGWMVPAKDLLLFEVGNRSVVGVDEAAKDSSVYRTDVRGISHPDALLIAAAPDLPDALQILMSDFKAVVAWAEGQPAYIIAQDAIAKAIGTPTDKIPADDEQPDPIQPSSSVDSAYDHR